MKTFDKFIADVKGRKIDFDNYAGVQCVDLIKKYINDYFGAKVQSIGNAKDYWSKRNTTYIKSMFVPVVNTSSTIPRKGDVFIRTNGTYGHIGICSGKATTEMFYAYEQNAGGTGEGVALHQHTNWATINFLRPRVQYVNANGGLYGYSIKKSTKESVLIPNGSKIEIIETECYRQKRKGIEYTFCRIIYNGKKYYVAQEYLFVR